MHENELIKLSTYHANKITGSYEPNMYGFAKELRYRGLYPEPLPLCVITQHGVSLWDYPQIHDLNSQYPYMLVFSKRMYDAWKSYSHKKCAVITNPYITYRKRKGYQKSVNAKGTIAFFAHSTKEIEIELDIEKYITQLNGLPIEYQPVSVCFHFIDILKGYHKKFIKVGINCYTAGHYENPQFIDHFYNTLVNFQYATSNVIGSYAFYAVEMNIPFFLYGEKPIFNNVADTSFPLGKAPSIGIHKTLQKAERLFGKIADIVNEEQKAFVWNELGINQGISNSKLMYMLYASFFVFTVTTIRYFFKQKTLGLKRKSSKVFVSFRKQLFLWYYKLIREEKIFTHLTFEEKKALFEIVRTFKRRINAVEIGSYFGASSCFIASATKKHSQLFCIDTWENDNMINNGDDPDDPNLLPQYTFNAFRNNIKKYKNKIIPIRAWSYDAISEIRKTVGRIDFLFIDGDHHYAGVKKDWDLYSSLLDTHAIVAFHDTGWADGVNRVIKEDVLLVADKIQELPNMQLFKIKRVQYDMPERILP